MRKERFNNSNSSSYFQLCGIRVGSYSVVQICESRARAAGRFQRRVSRKNLLISVQPPSTVYSNVKPIYHARKVFGLHVKLNNNYTYCSEKWENVARIPLSPQASHAQFSQRNLHISVLLLIPPTVSHVFRGRSRSAAKSRSARAPLSERAHSDVSR